MNKSIALLKISLGILIPSIALNLSQSTNYEIFGIIKPITLIQYSGFLCLALGISLIKHKIPKKSLDLAIILGFLIVMASFFEVMWSFGYWFAEYNVNVESGMSPNAQTLDTIIYTPSQETMTYQFYNNLSLNHSAKRNVLWLFAGLYFLWSMVDLKRNYGSR